MILGFEFVFAYNYCAGFVGFDVSLGFYVCWRVGINRNSGLLVLLVCFGLLVLFLISFGLGLRLDCAC